jgi:hypothetical protein
MWRDGSKAQNFVEKLWPTIQCQQVSFIRNITVLDNGCMSLSSRTSLRTFSIVTTGNKTLNTQRFGRSSFLLQALC